MQTVLLFGLYCWIGYLFFLYFSHPSKKKSFLPHIRFKNVELMPNIRIHLGTNTYHFHHWFVLSVLTLVGIIAYGGFTHLLFVKGAAVGGILQGLRYPTRFHFRHPRCEHDETCC